MKRNARFICPADQTPDTEATFRRIVSQGPWRRDDGVNRWYLYRKTTSLPSSSSAASLNITVDGRYKLYVNGASVGRGPARCSPDYQRVDHHDVLPHLTVGDNVIAVLVHVYGCDTAWYEQGKDYWQGIFGDGGLFVEGNVDCGDESIGVATDSSWRCIECTAWNRDTPKSGWGQDFIEDYDASQMPNGWKQNNFDDSNWPFANEMHIETDADDMAKGWGPIEPFPTLLPREIPFLTETQVAPTSIVNIHEVIPDTKLPIDRRSYEELFGASAEDMVENAECLLSDDDHVAVIRTSGNADVTLLLKFDQLHSGYPFIEIDADGGEIIELAIAETIPGEFLGEQESPVRIRKESYLDCAHVFRYKARPGVQRFEKFEWSAIRYIQLIVRNAPNGLRIRHIGSNYTHYPVENAGQFECSDSLLNRLWEIGRYTTVQCTHDSWEDCPGREKRQWLGDGIVHYLIGSAAFGTSTREIDRQFLRHGMEGQRPDGLLQMFAPGDHHSNGIVIPDFCLHWICTADYYYQDYGDLELIEELFPAVQRVLAWFDRQTNDDGLVCDMPYWHFIEWANIDRSGVSLAINAMRIGALKAAERMAIALQMPRIVDKYGQAARYATEVLNRTHWDDKRGAYVDSVDTNTGLQNQKVSQQANAAMICWDVAPEDRWASVIKCITDARRTKLTAVPPVATIDEPFDVLTDVVRTNTFFSHFLYTALAKARQFDLAMDLMRASYAPMLETGTTTLWESFDPAASLCHAFSASPVYQLSANVLGVRPLSAAFSEFAVAPQPGDLRHAKGVYPTVKGAVSVSWEIDKAKFNLHISVPEGTSAVVISPPGYETSDGSIKVAAGEHDFSFSKE